MRLNIDLERLRQFCHERGIARLELFGSVLREDFREDLLATLHEGAHPTFLDLGGYAGKTGKNCSVVLVD